MRNYQDVCIDGKIIPGERECEERFRLIAETLPSGSFTVLDVGANAGYFSRRIVQEFDATATAVDNFPGLKASEGVTVIPRRLDAAGLDALPRHDVVLALSVLHHMADWPECLRALRACRSHLILEICDPSEDWMQKAASRHEVAEQYRTVTSLTGVRLLGTSPRIGRDKKAYERGIFRAPGTLRTFTGRVFTGSGWCSRLMPKYDQGLDKHLGYQPYPGSLNIRLTEQHDLTNPLIDWRPAPRHDRQFWRAWIGDIPCHAHVPGTRAHGPDCLELMAPMRLREALELSDGDEVTFDVEAG